MLSIHLRGLVSCALLSVIFCSSLIGQEQISLEQALDQKLVRIALQGNGGYRGECLKILIENLSPAALSIQIPAGQIFASQDTSVQDLIVTQEALLVMAPQERKTRNLLTMCTQSFNMSPSKGERFRLGPLAVGGLLTLAQKISRKGYQNSTAQSAVWSMANQESVRSIYGNDTAMVRDIAQTISDATGIAMSEFVFTPRTHSITSIRTSIEGLLKRDLREARLDLVSPSGERIRTYFEGRKLEAGFRQFRVGASHTLGETAELYLRLMEGDEIILEKPVSPSDSVTPLLHLYQKVAMQYQVEQDIIAKVGVYDEADNLYFLIKEGQKIKQGNNRGIFIAGCYVPQGEQYYIKLKVNGESFAEKALDPNAPPPQLFAKISLRGEFRFAVPEIMSNAKVAIYTESGEMRRLIYDIHHLNAGNKRISYHFEHYDGPDQNFYIRLIREDGSIAAEQKISH
ncbi:MAG: hypothetical protein AB8H47_29005 [Bacteroidia bacterium]